MNSAQGFPQVFSTQSLLGSSAGDIVPSVKETSIQNRENRSGHWSEKEQTKYYAFLAKYKEKFVVKQSRREWKVFKAMAAFIKTRDANQCRSHHHKMTVNCASVEDALKNLKEKNATLEKRAHKYFAELSKFELIQKQVGVFQEPIFQNETPKLTKNEEQYPFFVNQGFIDPENVPKKLDISCLRTDITQNGIEQALNFNKQEFQTETNFSKGFPSTGLLSGPIATFQPFSMPFNPSLDFQYAHSMPFIYNIQQEQKLMECHQLFIRWVNKLNSLIHTDNQF